MELIKVAEEAILDNGDDDLSADKLKNAAATKKLAIFIISEVDSEFFRIHKELHSDIDIVKLAIGKDSNLFYSITTKLKNNSNV